MRSKYDVAVRLTKAETGRGSNSRVEGLRVRISTFCGFARVRNPSSRFSTESDSCKADSTRSRIVTSRPSASVTSVSPSTHFPQPLGPTTAVIPFSSKTTSVGSQNDFKTLGDSFFKLSLYTTHIGIGAEIPQFIVVPGN